MKLKVIKAELRPESEGKYTKKGRAYFFVKGNPKINPYIAKAMGIKLINPTPEDYRAALNEALKKARKNIQPLATWSKTAGCSCGCSPGFIFSNEELKGKELFVDVQIIQE